MAEIRPFRAWRYHHHYRHQMEALVSPLVDVLPGEKRDRLYKHPYNSIHLSLPGGENAALSAGEIVRNWKARQVIVQDAVPGIYSYFQYFTLPGNSREYCHKGFIAFFRICDRPGKGLLLHESTMPHAVNDLIALLKETQLNVSPTHGLYTDPDHRLEPLLDASIQHPVYETIDYQGVRNVLGVINDVNALQVIMEVMEDKQVILADGHHRYEASLRYKELQTNTTTTGREGFHYHTMYFTNTEANDLKILPIHRLARGIDGFSPEWLLTRLEEYFYVHLAKSMEETREITAENGEFGLLLGDKAFRLRLKPTLASTITWNFPKQIKELDLTIMHFFIFEKILGIAGKHQTKSNRIAFESNLEECRTAVLSGKAQFAVTTRGISLNVVKEVCRSGFTLPQKSSYFYPKVTSGLLFGSIQEDEFTSPFYSCL